MSLTLVPFTTINDYPDGNGSKLVITKSIPYIITPHKEYGHIVCLPDYVSGEAVVIGVAETFDKGVKYTQTLNKDHLLEVA
jgi:hypothetical protein